MADHLIGKMKVLKYSADPKTWKLAISCYWCHSQLEICLGDISHEGERGNYAEAGWDRYTCNCGACGTEIVLDEEKLPTLIRSLVQKKKK